MVTVSNLTFEFQNYRKSIPQFINNLKKEGFSDLNESILTHAVHLLRSSINEDFQDVIEVTKYRDGHEQTKIIVNSEMKTSALLKRGPRRGKNRNVMLYEISIFSDEMENNIKTRDLFKDVLLSKIKIKSEIIEGSLKEAHLFGILDRLKGNHRSRLIEQVSEDMLKIFMDKSTRATLKDIANIPYKIIPKHILSDNISYDELVKAQIFKESYIANCKNCPDMFSVYITSFESKEAVIKNLEEGVMICPSCGKELTTNSATIESVYIFTDIGQECAKGLWLEAYINTLLIKEGIAPNKIKCCHFNEKDELDHVFIDSSQLVVSETKDRNIGQNDIYITAMKATRIGADKVLLISTEEISKDILPQTGDEDKPTYISISGSTKDISKKLKSEIQKMRKEYVDKKVNNIKEILLNIEFERRPYRSLTIRP